MPAPCHNSGQARADLAAMEANALLPPTCAMAAPSISTAAQAFAAVALAAVACDGELAAAEARALRQQLEFRQPFCRMDDAAMGDLLDGLLTILRQAGWQALVEQAAPRLEAAQAETAFAVAAGLTLADHVESNSEQDFLEKLSVTLKLSTERAATIRDVVSLLNRDSLAG